MGCDIHLVVERKKANGKWVTVAIGDGSPLAARDGERHYPMVRDRNYQRFAALAGVRGEGPEPKGFPSDASQTAKYLYRRWESDYHSASYMGIEEATKVFLETQHSPTEHLTEYPMYSYFGVDSDDMEKAEHRIVFWFDN